MRTICVFLGLMFFAFFTGFAQSEKEQLATQYYQDQEYDKAVDLYEELYANDPSVHFYSYYLECLLHLEEYSAARRLVRKQKKRGEFPLRYDVELGYLYLQEGKQRKARRQFRGAIKEVPSQRQAYKDLADAFMNRDLYDYAIDLLESGNRKITSNRAFHMELANVYAKTGKYEKMMEEYLALLDKAPEYKRDIKDELQLFIEDGDEKKTDAIKSELLEASQKRSSNRLYPELLMWFSIQMKDFEIALMQAKALDRRLNEDGKRVFHLAKILADNRQYDLAIESYEYVMEKGRANSLYQGSLTRLLDVRFDKLTKTSNYSEQELVNLKSEYEDALDQMGKNASTIDLMKNLAHIQAFYLDNPQAGEQLLEEAITISRARPSQVAECKVELANILTMAGDVWEATLLYQQVEKAFKNEPLGHKAKFKNARLSFFMGEFQWALTQLDVLRAATSKLIANDAMQLALLIRDNIGLDSSDAAIKVYARADLYAFQRKPDRALKVLDTLEQFYAGHEIQDYVLYKKADIYIQKQKYHKADSLLKQLVDEYGYDVLADDALMKRAELNEFFLDRKSRAQSLYQKLIRDYPGSLYTVEARKRFRVLRGDHQPNKIYEYNMIN